MKKFKGGKMETTEVFDIDLFGFDFYEEVQKSMEKHNCDVIVITLENDFQIMYTRPDKNGN